MCRVVIFLSSAHSSSLRWPVPGPVRVMRCMRRIRKRPLVIYPMNGSRLRMIRSVGRGKPASIPGPSWLKSSGHVQPPGRSAMDRRRDGRVTFSGGLPGQVNLQAEARIPHASASGAGSPSPSGSNQYTPARTDTFIRLMSEASIPPCFAPSAGHDALLVPGVRRSPAIGIPPASIRSPSCIMPRKSCPAASCSRREI